MLKKGLSQHLIKDKAVLDKLAELAGLTKDDVVIEIGAGQGDLTRAIAKRAAIVYAIEIDTCFMPHLYAVERDFGNVKVINDDILKIPLSQFKEAGLIKVVGNIPYKITGPILFKILEERSAIEKACLTVQKEIAERIISKPCKREYGSISVVFQTFSDVKVLMKMRPGLFSPPPKVDSAFISIIFKDEWRAWGDELIGFMRLCFQNKRKYLKNTLLRHYPKEAVKGLYAALGLSSGVRAEQIIPKGFIELYNYLHGQSPTISGHVGS